MLRIVVIIFLFVNVGGNPHVSVIQVRRLGRPPLHVSNGVIVSPKLFISTLYPLALFPRDTICALLNARVNELEPELLRKNCILIGTVVSAELKPELQSNFAVVQFAEPLILNADLNRAMFTAQAVLDVNPVPSLCDGIFNDRTRPDLKVSGYSLRAQIVAMKDSKPFWIVTFQAMKKVTVCTFDNGLPLICEGVVVGLLSYIKEPYCSNVHVYRCIKGCETHRRSEKFQKIYVNFKAANIQKNAENFQLLKTL